MREYKLRLSSEESQELIELQLHPASVHQPLAELTRIPDIKVFANRSYSAQLLTANTTDIRSLEILINGYPAPHTFHAHSGNITFHLPGNGERIFADSFGLSSIALIFKTSQGPVRLKSEYFQIMVRPDDENFSVNTMGSYAARNNRMLLYGTQKDYINLTTHFGYGQYSMEDKIRLLKQTGILLEKAWRMIRINPKTSSTCRQGNPQHLDARMLQQLNRHPEALQPTTMASGVRIGHRLYVPDLAALSSRGTTRNTDVYENQVILSFLQAIIKETNNMIPSIQAYIDKLPVQFHSSGLFVTSSTYMARATALTLQDMMKDLQSLQKEFSRLYEIYASIIPASSFELTSLPHMTPAFGQIPGYRQIFGSIGQWFAMRNVSAADIRFATTFLQITTLYEVYVLSKLGRFFLDWDFQLVSARRILANRQDDTFYDPPSINNVFVYQREDVRVTLFYQPVIYDQKRAMKSSCNLVRNTSLSFPRGWGEPTSGRYYTPDYVVKIESERWKGAKYILGDAKYTTYRNVRDYKVIPLVYKYLFSLSTMDPDDEITGLYIFHGKQTDTFGRSSITSSVYDLIQSGHQEFPQVEIIGLSESICTDQREQFMALRKLFSIQFEHAAGHPLFEDQPDLSTHTVKAWQIPEAARAEDLPEPLPDSTIESEDQKPDPLDTVCQNEELQSTPSNQTQPVEGKYALDGGSIESIRKEAEEKAKEYLRKEYGLEDLDLSFDRFQKSFDQNPHPDQPTNPVMDGKENGDGGEGRIPPEASPSQSEQMEIKISAELPDPPDPEGDFDFDQALDFDLFEGEIDFEPEETVSPSDQNGQDVDGKERLDQ